MKVDAILESLLAGEGPRGTTPMGLMMHESLGKLTLTGTFAAMDDDKKRALLVIAITGYLIGATDATIMANQCRPLGVEAGEFILHDTAEGAKSMAAILGKKRGGDS